MICMNHAVGSLGTSLASSHRALCLLQMHGNSTSAKWTPHLLCWWQQERAEAGNLLKACPSREWPRLVTDFRGTGAGGVGGGGSRHS